MSFYPFFGLLWRKTLLAQVFWLGTVAAAIVFPVLTVYAPDFGISSASRVNLFPLMFPFTVGFFIIGPNVAELHHTLLAWTLPNLRRHILLPLLSVGIIVAFLATVVYHWLGGPGPLIPTFASSLFGYSIGLIAVNGGLRYDSDRPLRFYASVTLRFVLLILVVLSIDRIAYFYSNHPILSVVLTQAGTSLCFLRFHDVEVFRRKTLVPFRTLEQEFLVRKRTPSRRPPQFGRVTGVANWIRAGEYENFASSWGGWVGEAVKYPVIAAAIVIVLLYLTQAQEVDFLMGFQVMAPGIPAFLAMGFCANGSLFLQRGWLYPLSRAQLADLTYLSSLLYNAGICAIMLLAVLILERLVELDNWFGFRRPLALVIIVNPVFQWMRLRHGAFFTQIPRGMILHVCCVFGVFGVGLGWYWFGLNSDILLVHEVAACVVLVLLSQILFRYKVETYFRRADLV